MELNFSSDSPDESGGGGGGGDIVAQFERAMQNDQIRGMLIAGMKAQGIDPAQFGIPGGEPQNQDAIPMENSESPTESGGKPTTDEIDAQFILDMINGISNMAPQGDNTTIGTVRQYIEANPEAINARLEQMGE